MYSLASLIQAFVVGKMKLFLTFKFITLGEVHLLFNHQLLERRSLY